MLNPHHDAHVFTYNRAMLDLDRRMERAMTDDLAFVAALLALLVLAAALGAGAFVLVEFALAGGWQ
jgi:hypothetical protein